MLVQTRIGDAKVAGSWPDDLGRVFDTPTRSDRAYGAGGELQWRRDAEGTTEYEHEGAGRLSARTDPDGGCWRYHWNDAGRLVQVDRPDGSAVEFGYDALGRRLSKCAGGVQTCFVWDGDVVLHEWGEAREAPEPRPVAGEEAYEKAPPRVRKELRGLLPEPEAKLRWAAHLVQAARGFPALVARLRRADGLVDAPAAAAAEDVAGSVITWLFAPGGFSPLARLTAAGRHGLVTDQVGAPLVVLDGHG